MAGVVVPADQTFDVFLSHNSKEKPAIERVAQKLQRAGLTPWLDTWCLESGGDWQSGLAAGLQASRACAVFIGPHGIGDWAQMELKVALDRAAKEPGFRLFPVLLPGLAQPFDPTSLPPFLSTRNWIDMRDGIEDTDAFQSLINAIIGVTPGSGAALATRNDVCPYRGLQPFDEEHADLFFGRDGDIQRLVEKLKASRFLAVLGPSGSGKSSLIRAGLIPVLRAGVLPGSESWEIQVLKPGAHPLDELAARLAHLCPARAMTTLLDELARDPRALHLATTLALAERAGSERVLWVVDQFEEAFTLCRDQREREQFFANLLYAAVVEGGRCGVVLTMRADFYPGAAAYPELAQQLAAHQYLVGPLGPDGLRQAIEQPAWRVGLDFQPKLVETILADVVSQPGALPLLEHALLELWERRRGRLLTLEGYQQSGGVHGAIARRADTIYQGLDPEQQNIVRRTMLRLTQPGEGTEDTRRRTTLGDLVTNPDERDAVHTVVQRLADARLLTTSIDTNESEPVVDVAHEALIRGWPRLQTWLDEDRAGLRILRRLTEAALEWSRQAEDEAFVYRGAQLEVAIEWREGHDVLLNDLERRFVDASIALRDRELAEAEARERERIQRVERDRTRRRIIFGLTGGLAVTVVLALIAGAQYLSANEQRTLANDQREFARSLQLIAQANSLFPERLDLGLLLSMESGRINDSVEARGSLLDGLMQVPAPQRYLHLSPLVATNLAYSPDGTILASGGSDKAVTLWDTRTGERSGDPLTGHIDIVTAIAFSPDGRLVASGSGDGAILLWDMTTRQRFGLPLSSHSQPVLSVAFNPDGTILASAGRDATVILWDVDEQQPVGEPLTGHSGPVRSVEFSPDGRLLASGGDDRTIIVWDAETHQSIGEPLAGHRSLVHSVSFSPDGSLLASGSDDRTIVLWDVATGQPIDDPLVGHTNAVRVLAFNSNGSILASGGRDETIILWDVQKRQQIGQPLRGHTGSLNSLAFSPQDATLASSADDRTIIFWNVSGRPALGVPLSGHSATVYGVDFSPDGRQLASSSGDGTVVVWDTSAFEPVGPPLAGHAGTVADVAFSPDGGILASGGSDGSVIVWDANTHQQIGDPLSGHSAAITSLAFSPDGRILASASDDRTIVLWDTQTHEPLRTPLVGHTDAVNSVVFSPDGSTLATGSRDMTVQLWNVETGQPIGDPLTGHRLFVASLAFSPDGRTLASGSDDQSIILWDTVTRASVAQLIGHRDLVSGLAFSPDGSMLASSGEDFTVILWDVPTRKRIGRPLRNGNVFTNRLDFSPDGRWLASSTGPDITLWDVDASSWIRHACRIANRNLSEQEWEVYLSGLPLHDTCALPRPVQ